MPAPPRSTADFPGQRVTPAPSLYRIVSPRFCAGIEVRNNVCIRSAPCWYRMAMRRTLAEIVATCRLNGWTIELVEQGADKG